jgi:hypothetical protein
MPRYTKDEKVRVLFKYIQGEKIEDICRSVDVSQSTVFRWLKVTGIPKRPSSKKENTVIDRYINQILEDSIGDVLVPSHPFLNRRDMTNMSFFEKYRYIFDDENEFYFATLNWPEHGLSEHDFHFIEEREGRDIAKIFLEEVELNTRMLVYVLIALSIRGYTAPVVIRNRLKQTLGFNKDITLFIDKGIIEIHKSSMEIKTKDDSIQLTDIGLNLLERISKKMNENDKVEIPLNNRLFSEETQSFLYRVKNFVLEEFNSHKEKEKKIKQWEEKLTEVLEILFPRFYQSGWKLKKRELVEIAEDYGIKFINWDKPRITKRYIMDRIKGKVMMGVIPSKVEDSDLLMACKKLGCIGKNISSEEYFSFLNDKLKLRKELIRRIQSHSTEVEQSTKQRLKISECTKFIDLKNIGEGKESIDSISYFNSLQEGLIKPVDSVKDWWGEEIMIVGTDGHKILGSKDIKDDWLNMSPQIRRLFSENGICPMGIENKERCEQTWKAGSDMTKLLHKDIEGVRIEISSVAPRIYFWPKNGNKINTEDFFLLYKEIVDLFKDLDFERKKEKNQKNFQYEIHPNYIFFHHSGSKFISFTKLKKICLKMIGARL